MANREEQAADKTVDEVGTFKKRSAIDLLVIINGLFIPTDNALYLQAYYLVEIYIFEFQHKRSVVQCYIG